MERPSHFIIRRFGFKKFARSFVVFVTAILVVVTVASYIKNGWMSGTANLVLAIVIFLLVCRAVLRIDTRS